MGLERNRGHRPLFSSAVSLPSIDTAVPAAVEFPASGTSVLPALIRAAHANRVWIPEDLPGDTPLHKIFAAQWDAFVAREAPNMLYLASSVGLTDYIDEDQEQCLLFGITSTDAVPWLDIAPAFRRLNGEGSFLHLAGENSLVQLGFLLTFLEACNRLGAYTPDWAWAESEGLRECCDTDEDLAQSHGITVDELKADYYLTPTLIGNELFGFFEELGHSEADSKYAKDSCKQYLDAAMFGEPLPACFEPYRNLLSGIARLSNRVNAAHSRYCAFASKHHRNHGFFADMVGSPCIPFWVHSDVLSEMVEHHEQNAMSGGAELAMQQPCLIPESADPQLLESVVRITKAYCHALDALGEVSKLIESFNEPPNQSLS